jgi:hypothetical protein
LNVKFIIHNLSYIHLYTYLAIYTFIQRFKAMKNFIPIIQTVEHLVNVNENKKIIKKVDTNQINIVCCLHTNLIDPQYSWAIPKFLNLMDLNVNC